METTLLNVIRGYLPLLVGIAVAVVNLYATHTAHGLEVHGLAPEPRVVRETIVVTAKRERPMTASYTANAR